MLDDVRYAIRLLVRAPGFTVVAALTIAVAVGANTAMFSVVRGALLAPLPFPDPDRLMVVWEGYPPVMPRASVSAPGYYDMLEARDIFETVTAFAIANSNLTGGGEPERVVTTRATQTFQSILGLRLVLGRWFTEDEDRPNANDVVVLSDGLWRRRFGSDRSVIGRTIALNDRPVRVVGVMAPESSVPRRTDVWVPIAFTQRQRGPDGRGSQFLDAIARLRPGLSENEARLRLTALSSRLRAAHYADTPRWTFDMQPLHEEMTGSARIVLLTAFAAVGFLLIIACANVANLLLARGGSRRRELAVRAALGAPARRLTTQLLVETAVLGALGAGAGVVMAIAALPVLANAVSRSFPLVEAPRLDGQVFLFVLTVAAISTLAFGLLPAWQLARVDLRDSLAETQRGATGGRARRVFVVAEVALAFVLLVGAGLLVRSFARVMAIDPGFTVENRLTLRVVLPSARYPGAPQRASFYAAVLERLAAVPGIRAAGAVSELPLSGEGNMGTFEIEGRPTSAADAPHANWRSASPGYFTSMAIPLVSGRLFGERDGFGMARVAIVDELAAARYWPDRSPLGARVTIGSASEGPWAEIVGVVRSVHHSSLEDAIRPTLYFPLAQRPTGSVFAVLQTNADPASNISAAREAVRAIDPLLPVFDVRPYESRLVDSVGQRRIATWLIGLFGGVAVLLAALGVYGVIACDVSERTREIAVRVALGATRPRVIRLVLASGLRMTGLGIALGAVLALALGRTASALMFGISPYDPGTYLALGALLFVLATVACYLPARRAASQDLRL